MKAVTYCQTVATQSDSGKRYNLLEQFGRLPLVGRIPHHRRPRTPCRGPGCGGENNVQCILFDALPSPSSSVALSGLKATIELEELEAEETGVEEIEVEDIEDELCDTAAATRDAFSALSTTSESVAGSKATIEFEELGVEETGLEEIKANETEVEVPACGNDAEDFKRHPTRNETKIFVIEGGLS